MAHLNNIYIMTLERANRVQFCLGALAALSTPMEIVEPVYGIDDHDYQTALELCEAASADYPYFRNIIETGDYKERPIAYLAQRWNYYNLLKKIADGDNFAMLIQDDYCFMNPYDFWKVDDLVGAICQENLNCVVLGCVEEHRERYNSLPRKTFNDSELFTKAVGYYDTTLVFSPAGAAWMLEASQQSLESSNFQMSMMDISDMEQPEGFWTLCSGNASRPIVDDHTLMPSIVHTDNEHWVVQRKPETTTGMRTRKGDLPLGDGKAHLSRLPHALPEVLPAYDDTSTELIVLFPLFTNTNAGLEALLQGPHLTAAIWSRYSYLKNASVIEQGIPVKFYIEERVYKATAEYLETQGIRAADCLIFEDQPKADMAYYSGAVNLGLKLLPMTDDRLKAYKRVMIHDADMFLCKTEFANATFDILPFVETVPTDKIGVMFTGWIYEEAELPPSNWLSKIAGDDRGLWFDIAKSFLPRTFKWRMDSERVMACDNGVLYIYSPAYCDPAFVDYLKVAIEKLRDDEAVISLWHQMHADDVISVYGNMPYAFSEWDHGEMLRKEHPFFLSHLYVQTEYRWRQHIGDTPD